MAADQRIWNGKRGGEAVVIVINAAPSSENDLFCLGYLRDLSAAWPQALSH